jgi:hypothetical protein
MKKIVLSIAGVMAAAAFAPEAAAVPAFARQTGMACTACHQQHFPVLNGFGQAFKAAGYTMMGAQEKVEGEHLSIPSTLNGSMVLKVRYQDSNGSDAVGTLSGETTNGGQWQIPDEFALLLGGRVAENIGFLFEGALAGGGVGGIAAGFKMPIVFDMGAAKLSVIPFLTDALGVAYGYELGSTGAVRNVRWAEHRRETSAQQYTNIGGTAATGLAFVAQSDMGYINFTRWTPDFVANNGAAPGLTGIQLKSNYVRIAATPTMGDWAMHIGAQFASGSTYQAGAGTLGSTLSYGLVDTKASALDFQAQGTVADKEISVYATWSKANASTALQANAFNGGLTDRKAWTIAADYSVIPHVLTLGAAYRNADNGGVAGLTGDNAVTLTAVYDLAQNVALHVNYSQYSGSSYGIGGANDTTVAGNTGDSLTTFMLEAAW